MFYFLRITPANFLYAWWLSLRHPVGVWNLKIPERIAGRFQRLKPYRLFTRDEWLLEHDACFDAWKSNIFPLLSARHRCMARASGCLVDFSYNLWQVLGIEFERLYVFAAITHKSLSPATGKPCIVEPWIARAFQPGELERLFPDVRIVRSLIHRWLESLYEWALSAAHLGRILIYFLLSIFQPRRRPGRRPVVWLGISPQEIPDRDHRLNFAWAVQYRPLRKEDMLFVLPCRTNPAQRAYLSRSGVAWVEPHQMFTLLPLPSRLRALGTACRALLAGALGPSSTVGVFVARFVSQAAYWVELVETLGVRTYFTTISNSWPEKPELAVMKARDVKSVIWAYSANSLSFAIRDPAFRDVGVSRSIVIADEYWVWNEAHAGWLRKRQTDSSMRTTIRVTGPLMCGNAAWLGLDPASARRQLGLPREGTCIGVFDVPPANDRWRDRFGGGPSVFGPTCYESFCDAIRVILDRVPGCFALIKLKRDFGDVYRDFPVTLKRLVNEDSDYVKQGRVFVVDVNVDPYLPVAASDIAIGMTYTSPVLAVRAAGRLSVYFDPSARAIYPSSSGLRELTIQSLDELIEFVGAAVRGAQQPKRLVDESVTPPMPAFPHA